MSRLPWQAAEDDFDERREAQGLLVLWLFAGFALTLLVAMVGA